MNEPVTHIRFLNRHEIDIDKWDNCILSSPDGLIYARSFYLDIMAKNWSALVLDDYDAVMPLTWNRKYGFSYLYQPAFTAQLGVFFRTSATGKVFNLFIQQAKLKFKFCEINLNYANAAYENPLHTNYILQLGMPYDNIRKGYKKRLIENLFEAESFRLQYSHSVNFDLVIRLYRTQYGKRIANVKNADYQKFKILCDELFKRNMVFARSVCDIYDELLSTSIYFIDQRRIYNIMSVTLPAGREKRAHFYLLDQMIKEFASKNLLLDFEGSEIPGIAEFYRKFGSSNQPFPFLKFNHLPFPFRLFK